MGAGAIPVHIDKVFRERAAEKHKLKVYTADFGYEGDDRVNVSFHDGHYTLTPPKAELSGGPIVETFKDKAGNPLYNIGYWAKPNAKAAWEAIMICFKILK